MIRLNFADPRTKAERRSQAAGGSGTLHSGPTLCRRLVPAVGSSIVAVFWDHTCDDQWDYAGSVTWSHATNPPYRLKWLITKMVRRLIR